MTIKSDFFKKSAGNILFTFWDGGQGHLRRIMPLAIELHKLGYHIGFITSVKLEKYLDSKKYSVFVIENRKTHIHPPPYKFPIYSHAFLHAQRLKGLEFDDVDFLEYTIKKEVGVIQKFKPLLIINDYRDTIKISAEICNIPVVGVTSSNGNSNGYTMGWWIDIPSDLTLPNCLDSFNFIREKYGCELIADERQSFEGDISIIPNTPSIDPLISKKDTDFYTGILHELETGDNPKPDLAINQLPKKYTIFWYMGESNNRPYFDFDSILLKVIPQIDANWIIAGTVDRYKKTYSYAYKKDNIIIKPFFYSHEYTAIIERASLVINHGASTVMLALSKGIPFIAMPWNTETAANSVFASKHGAGIYLPHYKDSMQRIHANDLGEGVEIMGCWDSHLTVPVLLDAVNIVLNDDSYKNKAEKIALELKKEGGVRRAVEIVLSII